jgi:hypothetical protein
MRFFAIPAQFALAGAAVGLAFTLSGLPDPDAPVLVLNPAPLSVVSQGEAAPQPVDLDGDGTDDSATFNAAMLVDDAQRAAPAEPPENALVLRLVHIACPEPEQDKPVKAALAPEKDTPWILIASDGEKLPNVVGTKLRVGAAAAETRPVVIEEGDAPDDPAYVRAVAESCKIPPTVVS